MFKTETGFNISTIEDGTIIFYKKSEMYATIFYLGETSLLLCRADMTSMNIPLTVEERKRLTSPSVAIAFAGEFIRRNGPKWQ